MDPARLLAARYWKRAAVDLWSSSPPRVGGSNAPGGDPARPEAQGRQPEGAWKTATRDVDLVETVKLSNSTGRGPASRALPITAPKESGPKSCPGLTSPVALQGEWRGQIGAPASIRRGRLRQGRRGLERRRRRRLAAPRVSRRARGPEGPRLKLAPTRRRHDDPPGPETLNAPPEGSRNRESRPPPSDRSPRLACGEIIMRNFKALRHGSAALTCGGLAYRFRAEFRPPPASPPER